MSAPHAPRRLLPTQPPELVVHDEAAPCPYLEGRTSRLPLRLPVRTLTQGEFDARLVNGDRRQGLLLYKTACPDCRACEPIRIDVEQFRPGRTHRRVLRMARGLVRSEVGPPRVNAERVELYNKHKRLRGLTSGEPPIGLEGYRSFLVDSCCDTIEIRYLVGNKLLGVAVADRGEGSLSAVYCYFDPDHERLSPGVLSILTQIELCRAWGLRHLYLGLYIRDCAAMSYKGRFFPHERLVGGEWTVFAR